MGNLGASGHILASHQPVNLGGLGPHTLWQAPCPGLRLSRATSLAQPAFKNAVDISFCHFSSWERFNAPKYSLTLLGLSFRQMVAGFSRRDPGLSESPQTLGSQWSPSSLDEKP